MSLRWSSILFAWMNYKHCAPDGALNCRRDNAIAKSDGAPALCQHFRLLFVVCLIGQFLISPANASAAGYHHRSTRRSPTAKIIPGLGSIHHPVSTTNARAQQFFDQGLALVYGFNHDEARRSFEQAAKLDPKLAMAWWGAALAAGPNYNFPVDAEREKIAFDAIQKAMALQDNASEPERAYINALAFRFSNDPKADLHQLDVAYRNAMVKLVQHYPDDLDGATLYADSIMNLNPWELWTHDGRPNEGTEEALAVLEGVLRRDPDHIGANHLYIHAVEPSPRPERGLACAMRLESLGLAAGHLVHMPSHIYALLGDYVGAARVNEKAVAADERFLTNVHDQGIYSMGYYTHNLHFLAYANCMRGDFVGAKRAADKLVKASEPHVKDMAMLEGFVVMPYFVLRAFERWDDILKLPAPDPSHGYTRAQWHFVRAIAFAAEKKTVDADREAKAFVAIISKLPPDAKYDQFNTVSNVSRVQEDLLAAALKLAGGEARDEEDRGKAAVEALQHAAAAEDSLHYNEPPPWFPPVRVELGNLLLKEKKAAEAEKVFRTALDKTPRYYRALTGLRDSLKAQRRDYEAGLVDQQLRHAQSASRRAKN